MSNNQIKTKSIKTNLFFSVSLKLAMYLIPLITAPYVSRVLGSEGVGSYYYIFSIVNYFCLVVSFGFIGYGTIAVSSNRFDKNKYSGVFWSIIFSRLVLLFLTSIPYIILFFSLKNSSSIDIKIYLILSLSILSYIFDITYLFQGLENFKIISIINLAVRIASALLIFLLVKKSNGLFMYALIQTIQLIVIAVVPWIFIKGNVNPLRNSQISIKDAFKSSFHFFLPTLAVTLCSLVDKTMLGAISGNSEVGFYEQAHKIVIIVIGVLHSFAPVFASRISLLIKEGKEDEVNDKVEKMFNIYFLIIIPSIFGLYCVSYIFIPAFYGEDFVNSVNVMYWLIPLIAIISISNALGNVYFAPRKMMWKTSVFYFSGFLINVILNVFLIKEYGSVGAAIASLISEIVIIGLFVFFSKSGVRYSKVFFSIIKPLIASIIFSAIIIPLNYFAFPQLPLNRITILLIDVSIGVFVYFTILIALREKMLVSEIKRVFRTLKKGV